MRPVKIRYMDHMRASPLKYPRGPVIAAPVDPGVPLVAALPLRLPLVAAVMTLANAIAALGIGIGDNATTFQDVADRKRVGGECGTAESKGYCQDNHALTQHKLGIHHELPFRQRPYRTR